MSKRNDDENDFPFNDLFASVEQIFREFDRMFFAFASPDDESSSSPSSSTSLRDEVLKENFRESTPVDENLDGQISQFGFDRTFPSSQSSSSVRTRLERRWTPSGQCLVERQVEETSNGNEQTIKETTTKVCGESHHTTVKVNGQIQREFGNATPEELDRIDSSSSPSSTSKFSQTYSDLFKKLFS